MQAIAFLLIFYGFSGVFLYTIPNVKLDILQEGFRVSIPDEPGVKNVAFNVNRNRAFKTFEPGEFSAQIRKPTNNRWMFESKRVLEEDDIVYIWIDVQHNLLRYRSIADPLAVHATQNEVKSDDKPTVGDSSDTSTSGCELSITIVKDRYVCKEVLIFEENFDDDLSRWVEEVRLPLDDNGDAEFVLYDTISEVSNSILNILPRLWNNGVDTDITQGDLDLGTKCTGTRKLEECQRHPKGTAYNVLPPVVSARINTKNSFSFKFGRIEIRAKLPQGDWLSPQLLLEPLTNRYGENKYASGQIRIAFARGNKNFITPHGLNIGGSLLYGGIIIAPKDSYRDIYMVNASRKEHFGKEFHIYSLIWTDRELILKVDNQVYGVIPGGFSNSTLIPQDHRNVQWKTGEYMAPFDQEFYLTLGLSAGGHSDFPDDSLSNNNPKPWNNTAPKAALKFWRQRNTWKQTWTNPDLKVDYVRVYSI